jgi:hypothetical protein
MDEQTAVTMAANMRHGHRRERPDFCGPSAHPPGSALTQPRFSGKPQPKVGSPSAIARKFKMPGYLPVSLVAAFTVAAANVSAEEIALLPAPGRAVAECRMPAIPDKSNLIVLNGEGADRRHNLADLPNGLGERIDDETGKSYARAETELRGYVGPGIDGLRTFYPGDASDGIFGINPISQMAVMDAKPSYDACFPPPPSMQGPEDIAAANREGMAGLNVGGPPQMQWKGGIESRWLGRQTIRLRSETGEWEGAQLPKGAMWSLKAVSLPVPSIPERGKYFKALDVAAWNNEQVQSLPR